MKKARLILNIIALLLIVFQLLGYLGNMGKSPTIAKGVDLVAFYVGFNLPAILALILFLVSLYLRRRLKKKEMSTIVDSIGKS